MKLVFRKNHLVGQILYRSLDPSKNRGIDNSSHRGKYIFSYFGKIDILEIFRKNAPFDDFILGECFWVTSGDSGGGKSDFVVSSSWTGALRIL